MCMNLMSKRTSTHFISVAAMAALFLAGCRVTTS